MKKACKKDIIRQIAYNPRRFIAILLIVSLGVAFYSGVRAACPNMRLTLDKYFDKYNASDIQLISTMGFDSTDLQSLQDVEEIGSVMPVYSVDAYLPSKESPLLIKYQSVDINALEQTPNSVLNQPVLVEGKYPQNSSECLLDEKLKTMSQYQIGDTIEIQSGDNSSMDEYLNNCHYVISGFARSLEYISFERGSSSKGSGTIDAFVLLPIENFCMKYYTGVYMQADHTGESRFSDNYNKKMDSITKQIESIGILRNPQRYQKLKEEAEEKLNSGRKEISEGEKELEKGEKELKENEQKLEDSKKALLDQRTIFNREISEAQTTLEAADKKLNASLEMLKQKQQKLYDTEQAIEKGNTELEKNRLLLEEGKASLQQLQKQRNEISSQIKLLPPDSQTAKQLTAQLQELDKLYQESSIKLQNGQSAYTLAVQELDESKKKVETGKAALNQGLSEYNTGKAAYEKSKSDFLMQKSSGEKQLENAQNKINESQEELNKARTQFNQEQNEAVQKLEDAKKAVKNGEEDLNELKLPKWYVLDLSQNTGFEGYKQDTSRVAAIGLVFPLIFFLVAALVSLTNMTRMVEDDRTTIGILKALGYGRMAIASKYLIYALSAALVGIAIGVAVGGKLFPWVIYDAYGIMYTLPPLLMPINKASSIQAGLGALFCAAVPAFLVCQKELISTPASLMRPRPPKQGKRILLERISLIWKHLNFSQKVTCRNIFRYKKRLMMTVLGIAGCTALIFTGFGIKDSIRLMVPIQYDEIQKYDMMLSLKDNINEESVQAVNDIMNQNPSISSCLYFHQQTIDIVCDNQIKSVTMIVPQDEQQFYQFIDLRNRKSGRSIALDDSGVVLSEKICRMLDIKKGDTIQLKTEDSQMIQTVVHDITENYVYHYLYMTSEQYQQLFGTVPEYNSVFAQLSDTSADSENELSSAVLKSDAVSSVFFNTSLREHFSDMIKALNIVVLVLIISAAALAFIVLFSLTYINIDERKRELATLKVLGFYQKETSMYLYRENIIMTLIGILVGLGLGYVLLSYVLTTAEVDLVMFTRKTSWFIYLVSAFFTFLFSAIVNALTNGMIRKIDMVESMKSIE